mmetsp:Transcript_50565/g.142460  ORF Transcript_50565/g.142460 Transcript_50565/m.142460 type:complete len:347 (+) Transcript_50565:1024-2064(+)
MSCAMPRSSSSLRSRVSSPPGPPKPPPPMTASSGAGTEGDSVSTWPATEAVPPAFGASAEVLKGSWSASMNALISFSTSGPTMRCGAAAQRPTWEVIDLQAASNESWTRMSGARSLNVRTAHASRVAHGSRTTSMLPAVSCCCPASWPSSCASCSMCCTPSSSGKAARFSSRYTLFSAVSSRTCAAKLWASPNQTSCGTNSTDDATPSLISLRTPRSGSREARLFIRVWNWWWASAGGGASPASCAAGGSCPPSAWAPSGAGSRSLASGAGSPRCATTQTASGLDSRTLTMPWKYCFASSQVSLVGEIATPSCSVGEAETKPRSTSYNTTVPLISMVSRLCLFRYG